MKASRFKASNKPKSTCKYEEDILQKACILWFDRDYKDYSKLLNANTNNSSNGRKGKHNREMGVRAGRSDLVLYFNSKAYHIELKIKGNYQQPNQKEWQKLVESQGFEYVVLRSLKEFISYINLIIKG